MSEQSTIPTATTTVATGGAVTTAGPPARTVAVGARVISWYDDKPVEYGGAGDGPWTTLSFALFAGGLPVRRCEPHRVAPADVPVAVADPRVSVVKCAKADVPYGEPGPWRLTLPGVTHPSWHRIKRDAVAAGLRRLAILDWHAPTGRES